MVKRRVDVHELPCGEAETHRKQALLLQGSAFDRDDSLELGSLLGILACGERGVRSLQDIGSLPGVSFAIPLPVSRLGNGWQNNGAERDRSQMRRTKGRRSAPDDQDKAAGGRRSGILPEPVR
jgi:hypothetical protein